MQALCVLPVFVSLSVLQSTMSGRHRFLGALRPLGSYSRSDPSYLLISLVVCPCPHLKLRISHLWIVIVT